MVFFPPAKLNLGLHITGKRDDGFHDLESVFLPIGWSDILEVVIDEEVPQGQARFEWTGLAIPGDTVDNLVTRAHKRLADALELPGVSIYLHKVLPMGGGVGGGSANGTYTLRALNEVCKLGLSNDALMTHAAELGSDCPFFVQDAPALVRGRGEIVRAHRHAVAPGVNSIRDRSDRITRLPDRLPVCRVLPTESVNGTIRKR